LNWGEVSAGKVRITGAVGSGTSIPSSSNVSLVNMKLMVKCVVYAQETSIPIQIERYRDGIADMCPETYETDFLYRPCPRLGDVNGLFHSILLWSEGGTPPAFPRMPSGFSITT